MCVSRKWRPLVAELPSLVVIAEKSGLRNDPPKKQVQQRVCSGIVRHPL